MIIGQYRIIVSWTYEGRRWYGQVEEIQDNIVILRSSDRSYLQRSQIESVCLELIK